MVTIKLTLFIKDLTDKLFNILCLKEEEDAGNNVFLSEYIDSRLVEIIGACSTFPCLNSNPDYISVLNTVQYLSQNEVTTKKCKREVFKILKLLNKIERESGDDIE